MGSYRPQQLLFPEGIDEIALDRSLTRLPGETLSTLKRRILLEHRTPVTNSLLDFLPSPSRQLGQFEIPVFRINLLDPTNTLARLKISAAKLRYWEDYQSDPVIDLDLYNRDGSYFLTDVFDVLSTSGYFSVDILDLDYEWKFSRQLRVMDTLTSSTYTLPESYSNKLPVGLISTVSFSDTSVFVKEDPGSLDEPGDYEIDYANGVVFSYSLQHGYAYFTFTTFPAILRWQPVKVFELNDSDIDLIIKDRRITDSGATHEELNWVGAKYINELLNLHPVEWGI